MPNIQTLELKYTFSSHREVREVSMAIMKEYKARREIAAKLRLLDMHNLADEIDQDSAYLTGIVSAMDRLYDDPEIPF